MEARDVATYTLGLIIPVKMAEFSVPPSNDASWEFQDSQT